MTETNTIPTDASPTPATVDDVVGNIFGYGVYVATEQRFLSQLGTASGAVPDIDVFEHREDAEQHRAELLNLSHTDWEPHELTVAAIVHPPQTEDSEPSLSDVVLRNLATLIHQEDTQVPLLLLMGTDLPTADHDTFPNDIGPAYVEHLFTTDDGHDVVAYRPYIWEYDGTSFNLHYDFGTDGPRKLTVPATNVSDYHFVEASTSES